MKPLTELEERLVAEGGDAFRSEISQKLRATQARLDQLLTMERQAPEEFKRLSVLQEACRAAREVIDYEAEVRIHEASHQTTIK